MLDETTIGAELIWYAELDYNTYVDSLIKIEDLAEKQKMMAIPKITVLSI